MLASAAPAISTKEPQTKAKTKKVSSSRDTSRHRHRHRHNRGDTLIHIVIVSCGPSRVHEALTLIRSILLTSSVSNQQRTSFALTIFHDAQDGNDKRFDSILSQWQEHQQQQQVGVQFSYQLLHSHIPDAYADLFAPCACQRLFLHNVPGLDDVATVLYLDSDIVVLHDVAVLWDLVQTTFHNRPMALAAAVGEHEATHQVAYYRDDAPHPYYHGDEDAQHAVSGLNSGVLLLHLDRLRALPWNDELDQYRQRYELKYYDQDMINIYFAHHPDQMVLLPCDWNYRSDHCYFQKHCPSISLIHGNRGVFHKAPNELYSVAAFRMVYQAFTAQEEGHSVNGGLSSCNHVLQRLQDQVQLWLNKVGNAAQYNNNCEPISLPMILARLQATCQEVQKATLGAATAPAAGGDTNVAQHRPQRDSQGRYQQQQHEEQWQQPRSADEF